MPRASWPRVRGGDVAIDLGTANTLVYVAGRGIVTREPSVVAIESDSGDVYAVGGAARRMIGRTPARISAVRPLRHGVIADFEITQSMLRHFIAQAGLGRLANPRVMLCVPSGLTSVEVDAVEEACLAAGAREVQLIEESLAAAIGAGLDIAEPDGKMVVDVGGGTSEVAVLSLGGLVVDRSLRTGGYDLDEAIVAAVRQQHGLLIGQPTAEELKLAIARATPGDGEGRADVRGRDPTLGLPRSATLSSETIRLAVHEPLRAIVAAVVDTLEATPPQLAADIATNGILLAGGGCLLPGFDELLHEQTGMTTHLADSPLDCVALGAGAALHEPSIRARRRPRRIGVRLRRRGPSRRR